MRLPPPLIENLSRRLIRALIDAHVISSDHPERTIEKVERLITADLSVEDDIMEEARLLLLEHQAQIKDSDLEYHTLIAKAKGQIANKRGYILSSGPGKLSREKQHDLARQVVNLLLRDDDVEYYLQDREFHPAVQKAFEREMARDAQREEKARQKVLNIKRHIPEESSEFHALFQQFYKELLDKES